MADDPLRELLSSPLDTDTPERRRRERPREPHPTGSIGPWLPLGIVLGALAVIVGVLVGGDDTRLPTTTLVVASTSTTTTAPAQTSSLPAGYTSVADGRLGVRVERVLVRPDAVFVTVSTVVPSGLEGDQTPGFTGALWQLELVDGRSLDSLAESRSASSPGFVTVRFEPDDYDADDIQALRMVGIANRLGDDQRSAGAATFTLPDDPTETVAVPLTQDSFDLDVGVSLVFGEILFQDGVGTLEWHLEGFDDSARAAVFPELSVTDPATGTEFFVGTEGSFGGFVFNPSGLNFFEDAAMSRGDSVTFSAVAPGDPFPTGVPLEASLQFSVSWDVFTPTDVTIPIDDVVVAEL